MVGEVEALIVVPSELSQPWEKTVCPVPPFDTGSVPEMVASVVVATQVDCPSIKVRTNPGVPTPKSVEVATERASPVEPVGFPRSDAAETCAKFPNGRSPVTSRVRSTVAQVATPAPLRLLTNWLVQDVPWYSESDPSAPASGSAEVIEVIASLLVVALVAVALVTTILVGLKLVAEIVVAKKVVEVAFVVVALRAVKFWRVDDAREMRPPQNCDATVVDVATR